MTPSFALPLGALCLAFWPVWAWFAAGTVDGSNDSAGLLAAAAAIAIVLRAPPRAALRLPLLLPALCVALYLAACVIGVALSARALLAALALASLASASRLGKRLDVALAGLCVLALPLAATLQFYLGYPLRVVAGELSVLLLQMNGLAVVREGALLAWDGKLIAIDAPCSGIRMLWAGLFLACAMAAAVRLPAWRTLGALALAAAVVVAANGVRASALFYSETGIVHLPAWTHAGMGVVCFVGAALAIVLGVRMLREGAR
jgi:exosortase/archaeosortase family protein